MKVRTNQLLGIGYLAFAFFTVWQADGEVAGLGPMLLQAGTALAAIIAARGVKKMGEAKVITARNGSTQEPLA